MQLSVLQFLWLGIATTLAVPLQSVVNPKDALPDDLVTRYSELVPRGVEGKVEQVKTETPIYKKLPSQHAAPPIRVDSQPMPASPLLVETDFATPIGRQRGLEELIQSYKIKPNEWKTVQGLFPKDYEFLTRTLSEAKISMSPKELNNLEMEGHQVTKIELKYADTTGNKLKLDEKRHYWVKFQLDPIAGQNHKNPTMSEGWNKRDSDGHPTGEMTGPVNQQSPIEAILSRNGLGALPSMEHRVQIPSNSEQLSQLLRDFHLEKKVQFDKKGRLDKTLYGTQYLNLFVKFKNIDSPHRWVGSSTPKQRKYSIQLEVPYVRQN